MSTFDRAAHTRIEPPAVHIQVAEIAGRQEAAVVISGVPNTRQGRDGNGRLSRLVRRGTTAALRLGNVAWFPGHQCR